MRVTEKLLIYPFNTEVMPLLRSRKFREKYNNIILCALRGSGVDGKDASEVDGGEIIGITINEDFQACINECSSILYLESQNINIKKDEIQKNLDIAKMKDKKVINLKDNNKNSFQACNGNTVYQPYNFFDNLKIILPENINYEISYRELVSKEGLVDITTPVIGVVGTGESTNKFAIQLSIIEELESMGYKVSWIGTNKLCELVGGHSFPEFMFEDGANDKEKVLLFNRYVKSLEVNEEADIILIGVPGAIMPCSKKVMGDFGILAYKVFQAVSPDYLVLSIFYDEYRKEFFEQIKMHVKYKFGCDLNTLNICNKTIDWEVVKSSEQNQIPCYTIESENADNIIQNMREYTNVQLVNIMRKGEIKLIVDNIINELADDEPNLVF